MRVLLFDTETTDLNGYMIEGCFLLYDVNRNKIEDYFVCAFNPLAKVNPEVVKKFHINEEALKEQRPFKDFESTVTELLHSADLIVAHNVSFDLAVLKREYARLGKVLNVEPKKFHKKNVFCTMIDCKYELAGGKWLKLEDFAPKVAKQKAKNLTARLLQKAGYNPDSIRTQHIDFHNAVFDTTILTYSFSFYYRSKTFFKNLVHKRLENEKVMVKKNLTETVIELLQNRAFKELQDFLKTNETRAKLVLAAKGHHQPILPDKPDEKRKILFRDRLYFLYKNDNGWHRERLNKDLQKRFLEFNQFLKRQQNKKAEVLPFFSKTQHRQEAVCLKG